MVESSERRRLVLPGWAWVERIETYSDGSMRVWFANGIDIITGKPHRIQAVMTEKGRTVTYEYGSSPILVERE